MNEMQNFKKVKEEINNISPSFCAAKWQQVTLHLHNGRTHSCHHPRPHQIPVEEIKIDVSALHNTKFKKEQRKQMLDGIRPKECQYCWNVEDLDGYSREEFFSDRVTKSAAPWAQKNIQNLAKMPWDMNVNPSYVEVSFSNLCNFKCSYCSPVYSSRWVEEVERHGPYPTSWKFNDINYYKSINELPIHHSEYNPYVEAFWKWWPDLVKDLQIFRITGGEPLLSEDTFKVIDYLYENPQPGLEFAVNTNGCVPDKLFDKFITGMKNLLNEGKIKKAHVYTSVDGWGKYAEYGRNGLDFEQWQRNVDRLLSEIPTLKVTIMCTTNIFSIVEFKKLMEFVYDRKIKYLNPKRDTALTIDTAILRFPQHQNLSILTEEYLTCFDDTLLFMKEKQEGKNGNRHYYGFYDFEISRLERLIEFMKQGPNANENINLDSARKDFFIFVNEHDARRNTNFLETFPELENFYNTCQNLYLQDHS